MALPAQLVAAESAGSFFQEERWMLLLPRCTACSELHPLPGLRSSFCPPRRIIGGKEMRLCRSNFQHLVGLQPYRVQQADGMADPRSGPTLYAHSLSTFFPGVYGGTLTKSSRMSHVLQFIIWS